MPTTSTWSAETSLTGELAFYHCYDPNYATIGTLVNVAGACWTIEECFGSSKNETALDHYQVRTWNAWHRHITLERAGLADRVKVRVGPALDVLPVLAAEGRGPFDMFFIDADGFSRAPAAARRHRRRAEGERHHDPDRGPARVTTAWR